MDSVVILSKLEQEYLLRVIESARAVRNVRQFFLWTQGQLQALLPHRIMVCMQFDGAGEAMRIECLHSCVLDESAMHSLCNRRDGLALTLARLDRSGQGLPWTLDNAPDAQERDGLSARMAQAGLDNVLVHGSGRLSGGASVFALFGLDRQSAARHAYFLDLLLPYLHMALLRVAGEENAGPRQLGARQALVRPLSAREAEILHWVREGKSNFEIGLILGISGLTVKNHLQRIYRILGVSNRTQAISCCISMGLLERPSSHGTQAQRHDYA